MRNDANDAGDIGAGHGVTALYEIIPASSEETVPGVDPLRYAPENDGSGEGEAQEVDVDPAEGMDADGAEGMDSDGAEGMASNEWLTVKIRYKEPDAGQSKLLVFPVEKDALRAVASDDFTFASAVAEAGLVLRDSAHKSAATMEHAVSLGMSVMGNDEGGYRKEFVDLMSRAGAQLALQE